MAYQDEREGQRTGWLTFNLRWLLLSLVAVLVMTGPGPANNAIIGLLVLTGLYNFLLMLYEFADPGHDWLIGLTLALDFALGLSLYASAGATSSRLIWMALLPGLTAALRFKWPVALSVTAAFLALQAAVALSQNRPDSQHLVTMAGTAIIILLFTLGAAFAVRQLRLRIEGRIRQQYWGEAQRSQVLRQHARAIYQMSSMMSASLNYKDVLEAALNFGALGAEGRPPSSSPLVGAALFFQEDQLHVTSSRRLTNADLRVVCPGRTGILGDVIRTGQPAIIDDPAHDPELTQFASFQACRSLMALPLQVGNEVYGVVVYGHRRPKFFDDDQRAMLMAAVNQAVIGLQNAQLFRNLRAEKERLIEVQEEAQKELARNLHDGPAQALAALATRAHFVRHLLERDVKTAGEELFKMEELARRTAREFRHMLFTLRPLVLESHGLRAALQQLAEKTKETHGQTMIVEADPGVDDRLEMNHQGVLFHIVEEAVNNARKHAQANHIWVRLKTRGDVLAIEVKDDGVGFDVGAVESSYNGRGSLGMVNMRERAEMINGSMRIDSAEGSGTRVTVFVPLTEPSPARAAPRPAPIGAAVGKIRTAELEPQLTAPMALRTAATLTVKPAADYWIETKPQRRVTTRQPAKPPAARRGQRLPVGLTWAAASVTIVTVLLTGAGTAAASSQSMPGDLLYGVKRADESARVFFSPASTRAFVYADLAQERLVEMTVLSQRGHLDAAIVNSLTNDLITQTASALALVDDTPVDRQADVLSTLVSVTGEEQTTLAALKASAPPEAQAGLDRALLAAGQGYVLSAERLEQVLASHGGPTSSPTVGSAGPIASATPTPTGETEVPPGQTLVPPGQTKVPPGQTKIPPGQTKIPPGRTQVPPGQTQVPPGQTKVPPGQTKVPPAQTPAPKQTKAASGKP